MSAQSGLLKQLLDVTHKGYVFGEDAAFGPSDAARRAAIGAQTSQIIADAGVELAKVLSMALPEATKQEVAAHVRQITTKAGAFVSALTAGDLTGKDNTRWLTQAVMAVCAMYAADQLTDRGDISARLSIEQFIGMDPRIDPGDMELVAARTGILTFMGETIDELAAEGDGPHVMVCFDQLVLGNEARLQQLSDQYVDLPEDASRAFLGKHAVTIADLMVADAGFQSVTSVLHTIYRRNDPSLPTIKELHANPVIVRTIQVCNVVARVADERGDWWMDAGNDPRYGVFSINPFNQYHPQLVARLCELAGIVDAAEVEQLQEHFQAFSLAAPDDQQTRDHHGQSVTDCFFKRMRDQVIGLERELPAGTFQRFRRYITLCMRVGEISFANMLGDIHMAGGKQA